MSDLDNTIRLGATSRGLSAAAALLRRGGAVAFPTETVYGLGADARNPDAVARIYAAKGRPDFNPLIVHVADMAAANALGDLGPDGTRLAAAFWPGALTLVVPLNPDAGLAPAVTAGLPSVALRVPAHPLARDLLAAADMPLAAPSANPSGRISPTTADHVMAGLAGRIAGVIDGGPCPVGIESTIVGLTDATPRLLRAGGIPAEALARALGRPLAEPQDASITAPGQLASHYAPETRLILNATEAAPDALWLAFGPLGSRQGLSLSDTGDMTEAAARLFAALHDIDAMARDRGITTIHVDPIPDTGLGQAINDRLSRAAAPRQHG